MSEFRRVASLVDLPEGQSLAVDVGGESIALFNVDGTIHAVAATCQPHHAPLERGQVTEGQLQCPWHGAVFDLREGVCSAFPSRKAARTFEVRIEGDSILVAL